MVRRFPIAVFLFLIHPEGQRGDRFRDDADAGVNGGYLYGVPGIDRFAGRACAKVESRRAGNSVLGLVAGAEKKLEWILHGSPPHNVKFQIYSIIKCQNTDNFVLTMFLFCPIILSTGGGNDGNLNWNLPR